MAAGENPRAERTLDLALLADAGQMLADVLGITARCGIGPMPRADRA
jgi:hypothetical protein